MIYFILCILSIFLIELNESKPQYDGRILFSGGNNGYFSQPNSPRQGTIDEFLAIRSTTERLTPQLDPCYPQPYPRRHKRSPHFKRKRIVSTYPAYASYPNGNSIVPTRAPYSHYGGYYCGNGPPYIVKPPGQSHLLSQLFGSIFGVSSQQGPPNNDVRPVYENLEYDDGNNGVISLIKLFVFIAKLLIQCELIQQANQWRPGKPVGGIQNTINGYHQDLSHQRPNRHF